MKNWHACAAVLWIFCPASLRAGHVTKNYQLMPDVFSECRSNWKPISTLVGYQRSDSNMVVLVLAVAVDSRRTSITNYVFWGLGIYFIFYALCELSIYQCHCMRHPPRWLFINSVESDSAMGAWLFKVLCGTVWDLAAKERLDGVISHNTVRGAELSGKVESFAEGKLRMVSSCKWGSSENQK